MQTSHSTNVPRGLHRGHWQARTSSSVVLIKEIPHQSRILNGAPGIFFRLGDAFWPRCRLDLFTLCFELGQETINICLDLVHLLDLVFAARQLFLHHHDERFTGLVWSVEVEKVVGVDEQIAHILHLRFKLLRRNRQNADELQEIEEKRFADFQKVVGVVEGRGGL